MPKAPKAKAPTFLCLLLAGLAPLLAADPSEQFLSAYQGFQQGEELERSGNTEGALQKYRYAESLLVGISQSDASWQKPVVEYRLKKVRESINHLQGGDSAEESSLAVLPQPSTANPVESPVPNVPSRPSGPSITIVPPGASSTVGVRPGGGADSGEVQRLRRMVDDLKGQLEEARSALQDQKSRASDLENAEWAKKRSELTNELDQAKRRISDLESDLKARSSWGDDLKNLQKKLDDAVADKLVADEQYQAGLRKAAAENASLTRQLQEAGRKLAIREDSRQKIDQLKREVESSKESMQQLAAKLEHSEQAVRESAAKNEEFKKQGGRMTAQLALLQKKIDSSAKAAKAAADQASAKAAAADADRAALEEDRERLLAKLDQAGTDIKILQQDSASLASIRTETARLREQLDGNSKVLEETKSRLAEAQRTAADDLAQEHRRSEASEGLKKLLQQQNTSLQDQLRASLDHLSAIVGTSPDAAALQDQLRKLQEQIDLNAKNYADSRQQISDLMKARPEQEKALQEKEKALTEARKQAEGFQTDLVAAKQKIVSLQSHGSKSDELIKEMQDQLSDRDAEIARLRKRKGKSSADDKTIEENTLLRGIVLREIKEEAKRAQARRLMEEELKRLNVQSQSITEQIAVLSAPSVELTPRERALFKDAQLQISEPGETKLEASIAITKQADSSSVTDAAATGSPSASMTNPPAGATNGASVASGKPEDKQGSVLAAIPWQGKLKELLAKAKEEFDRQDYLQAENTFQEALKFSPNDYFALSNLGVVQFQLGKMTEAEDSLKKASDQSKDNSFALTTLGIVHYRQHRLPDAEAVLRKSLTINDQDFTAHNYLGIVLAASGKGGAGESEIMKALEINPQYADAHFNLAVIYATGKPPSKMMAKKHYAKALELGSPPDPSLEHLIE